MLYYNIIRQKHGVLNCSHRARLLKSYPSSKKSSPSRTPIKKNIETKRNILEPKMKLLEDQTLTGSRPNTLTVMMLDNSETSV